MRRIKHLTLATALVAGAVGVGGPASAAPAQSAAACSLTMGNVGYSANMLYVSARLSGDCYGQVAVDLQLSSSASGPWTTVDTTVTYPLDPAAQGGTAWFDNLQGCGFYYRGVGTYGDLTEVSPNPRRPC